MATTERDDVAATSAADVGRIICLEEHIGDRTVAAAVGQAYAAQTSYAAGIGSRCQEDPDSEPRDRPRLVGFKQAFAMLDQPIDARLAAMDAAGIDMHVLSLSSQPQLAAAADAVALVRGANDRLAETVAKYPDRFSAFFSLPWQSPEAAVREAQRCVGELGLRASLLTGRPDGNYMIDDARFEPVLAALAALDAPLYIHPGPPLATVQKPYYGGFDPELTGRLSLFGWGWHNEAGIQVIRLILSGALDRHRGLKLISGHWGEMVPFFLQRLDDALPQQVTRLERTITQTYRDQVWVTPSGMLYRPNFHFVREVLGAERILFAVDYPFLTMNGARAWLQTLLVNKEERIAIAHGNAEALLHLG